MLLLNPFQIMKSLIRDEGDFLKAAQRDKMGYKIPADSSHRIADNRGGTLILNMIFTK